MEQQRQIYTFMYNVYNSETLVSGCLFSPVAKEAQSSHRFVSAVTFTVTREYRSSRIVRHQPHDYRSEPRSRAVIVIVKPKYSL